MIVSTTLSRPVRISPSMIRSRVEIVSFRIPFVVRRVSSLDADRTRTDMCCGGIPEGGGVLRRRTIVERRQPPVAPKRATEGK